MTVCSVEGCDRHTLARGWCGTHYQMWRKGEPVVLTRKAVRAPCSVTGCGSVSDAKGMCPKHYARAKRLGSVELPPPIAKEDRFWSKVDRSGGEDACWEWLGTRGGRGYGRVFVTGGRRTVAAHRVAYELIVGPIPDGYELDHLCRNHPCVNPAHLEPVSHWLNVMRGEAPAAANIRKLTCHKGHPLTACEPTRGNPNGFRRCDICGREARRNWKKRRRTAA